MRVSTPLGRLEHVDLFLLLVGPAHVPQLVNHDHVVLLDDGAAQHRVGQIDEEARVDPVRVARAVGLRGVGPVDDLQIQGERVVQRELSEVVRADHRAQLVLVSGVV